MFELYEEANTDFILPRPDRGLVRGENSKRSEKERKDNKRSTSAEELHALKAARISKVLVNLLLTSGLGFKRCSCAFLTVHSGELLPNVIFLVLGGDTSLRVSLSFPRS